MAFNQTKTSLLRLLRPSIHYIFSPIQLPIKKIRRSLLLSHYMSKAIYHTPMEHLSLEIPIPCPRQPQIVTLRHLSAGVAMNYHRTIYPQQTITLKEQLSNWQQTTLSSPSMPQKYREEGHLPSPLTSLRWVVLMECLYLLWLKEMLLFLLPKAKESITLPITTQDYQFVYMLKILSPFPLLTLFVVSLIHLEIVIMRTNSHLPSGIGLLLFGRETILRLLLQ